MLDKKQIIEDTMKIETPPTSYNLLEIQCFLALKELINMYNNKQISSNNATITKKMILKKYEDESKKYKFEKEMFQEYLQNLKITENDRTTLRKILNKEDEWKNKPNGTGIIEAFDLSIKILNIVFKGEFY